MGNNKERASLPPRRGKIGERVFKDVAEGFHTVVEAVLSAKAGGKGKKKEGEDGSENSGSKNYPYNSGKKDY
ncbi:hypothetical protein SLEP1_g5606 [Rubroshorea leprosula]|uniref:Uncharacterized protein n=1 Tax=Rubroshorea leprosula TaxID=152421 RepID=A0AAV5I0H1_9ROSI|nr:hypothetical protein SLEP1_g5606 [Rubroshorea leprosula]